MQKCKQQELGEAEAVLVQLGRNKESKIKTSTPNTVSAAGLRKTQNTTNFLKRSLATKKPPLRVKSGEQTETCSPLLEVALEELESRSSPRSLVL